MAGYIPSTRAQQEAMLRAVGLDGFDALFADIPESVRLRAPLHCPSAMCEPEVMAHLRELSCKNANIEEYVCFLGAGAYDHYIPAAIRHLVSRQEFLTAYTPYQPEISQGTLQAIFEYQTMICELTGMDVANASMYDGASALAEAAAMACGAKRKTQILIAQSINPAVREVVSTYARFKGYEVLTFGCTDGQADLGDLDARVTDRTAVVLLQSPNFYGCIEDVAAVAEIAHRKDALLAVSCDPISLAILKPPGDMGADIAVGEGQSLGSPLQFGGPYLGFFAVKEEFMRRMPGRIVGKTTDKNGNDGFVLTLQAREQHIRREKATSNICSNQALVALTATIYLSLLGKTGLREVALQCARKAHYAYDQLIASGAFEPCFTAPFFKEFTVRYRGDVTKLNAALMEEKIIGGLDTGKYEESLMGGWIVAVTEKRTHSEIDRLVRKAVSCCG